MTTLVLLAIPVACISWTIAETELFRDLRDGLKNWACNRHPQSWLCRKLAYLPTCYYCTSHYVAALTLLLYPSPLLAEDWRGHVLGWFSLVGVSAVYLSGYNMLRVALRWAKANADRAEARATRRKRLVQRHLRRGRPRSPLGPGI